MKKVIAIIVVLSLLMQCTIHLGLWGYYQANKGYIAQNLCENRNKPEKKCCGKCYLRKQMKKVDESGSSSKKGQVKTERTELSEFVVANIIALPTEHIFPTSAYRTPALQNMFGHTCVTSIFHPPSISI